MSTAEGGDRGPRFWARPLPPACTPSGAIESCPASSGGPEALHASPPCSPLHTPPCDTALRVSGVVSCARGQRYACLPVSCVCMRCSAHIPPALLHSASLIRAMLAQVFLRLVQCTLLSILSGGCRRFLLPPFCFFYNSSAPVDILLPRPTPNTLFSSAWIVARVHVGPSHCGCPRPLQFFGLHLTNEPCTPPHTAAMDDPPRLT